MRPIVICVRVIFCRIVKLCVNLRVSGVNFVKKLLVSAEKSAGNCPDFRGFVLLYDLRPRRFFILSTAVTCLSTILCLEHINIFDSCKIIAAVLVCEHGISPHCGAYTFAGGVCFVKA